MRSLLKKALMMAGIAWLTTSPAAQSANVLFVSDADDDTSIVTALEGDGHTVTAVYNDYDDTTMDNTVLQGDLSPYSIIVWSAGGSGSGSEHNSATTTNLANWVANGGRLFVTGYDSIASPLDPALITLIGAAVDAEDESYNGPISATNSLTTGVVDLIGVTPADLDDQDGVPMSDLVSGATCVSGDGGYCSWLFRTLGGGEIAYVSSDGESAGDWTDSNPADDYHAYNAALRNFVAGDQLGQPTPVPALPDWGLILMSGLMALAALSSVRRYT